MTSSAVVNPSEGPLDTAGPSFGDPTSDTLVRLLQEAGIGGRLPSERELAERLNVSRTLLRDRLGLLESLGVLRRRSGAGTYVQNLDPSRLGQALNIGLALSHHTTDSLQSVRIALERQAAKEAAIRQDHVDIAYMHKALDTIEANRNSADVEQADFDFHAALLHASGNASMIFFAEALTVVLRRAFAERRHLVETIQGHQAMMSRIHRRILEAVLSRDQFAAMAAVDAHFTEFQAALDDARSR